MENKDKLKRHDQTMKKVISIIRTILCLTFGISIMVVGFPVVVIAWFLDRSGKIVHYLQWWYLCTLSFIIGIRMTVFGKENIDRKQTYLITVNHKSSSDIFVAARALPIHFKFFAASYLFAIPIFGWCLSMAGYLPIDRGNRRQARESLIKGTKILKQGKASLVIFPEGTRIEDAVIQDFKFGFLRIVTEAKQPILPVVMDGTVNIKTKDNFWFRSGRVFVSILPAEPTEGLEQKDWEETKKRFEELYRKEYDRIHKARLEFLSKR